MPRFAKESVKVWSLIPQWAHAYQVEEAAIINQLYTAHAWCDSNPRKAPKRLITRFLWSWMASAKRYNNLKTQSKPAAAPVPEETKEDMTIEEMRAIRRKNMPQYRGDPQKYPGAIETEAEKNVA